MQRITIKDLERRVDYLNEITNSPLKPYSIDEDTGKLSANIGNFHISQQYGGVCLHRMANIHGGINCPLEHYHAPKRELFDSLNAFISGIEFEVTA